MTIITFVVIFFAREQIIYLQKSVKIQYKNENKTYRFSLISVLSASKSNALLLLQEIKWKSITITVAQPQARCH